MKALLQQIESVKQMKFVMKHKKKIIGLVIALFIILIFAVVGIMNMFSHSYQYGTTDEAMGGMAYGTNTVSQNSRSGFAKMAPSIAIMDGDYATDDAMESMPYPEPPYEANGEAEYEESIERKLIKNGSISLVVKDIAIARDSITTNIESLNGFISQANFYESERRSYNEDYRNGSRDIKVRSGSLQIRIPSDNFDQALSVIKQVGLKVQNENVSTNDVTERYSDLETQITNKQAEETQYRDLLKRATKIEDILKITKYLNQARSDIERMQGQLNRLSNQVNLSTIHVSLTAEEDIEVFGVVWSPWQEIKAGFQDFLQDMVNFINVIIHFVFALPGIILSLAAYIAVIGFVIYVLYKVGRKIVNKVRKSN